MNSTTRFLNAALVMLAAPMAALAALGSFTRFHGDDFCLAGGAMHQGVVGNLLIFYTQWTGRFSYLFFSGLLGLLGPQGASIISFLLIGIWWFTLTWTLVALFSAGGLPAVRRLSGAAAGLILLVFFMCLPNLFQPIFWHDGQVNYALPCLGLTLMSGILLRAWLRPTKPSGGLAAFVFVLAFVLGGFSEAFGAMQVTLWLLALAATGVLAGAATRQRMLPLLGWACGGALLALLVVFVSPGNQVRSELVGERQGLVRVLTFSIRNAALIARQFFIAQRVWALPAILVPFLSAWWLFAPQPAPRRLSVQALAADRWVRAIVLLPLSTFVLMAATCAPVVYVMNSFPDDRILMVPLLLLVNAVVLSAGLLGMWLRRRGFLPDAIFSIPVVRLLPLVLAIIVLGVSAFALRQTIAIWPEERAYAQAWDKRHDVLLNLKRSGESDVIVPGLNARFGIGDLRVEPDYWINRCMAEYYGFASITGR